MVCELIIQDNLLAGIFLCNPTEIPRPMNFSIGEKIQHVREIFKIVKYIKV